MRPGVWRHPNCLDMDLEVIRVTYPGPKYLKVKVNYLSRDGGYRFNNGSEIVKIQRKDLGRWKFMGASWQPRY
jgi:hypothetical protein